MSSTSLLEVTTMQISSMEASVHETSSAPEITLAHNVTPSPATYHITMAMPSKTTNQTSSFISTDISIPAID